MPYYCTVPRCTSMAGKAKNVSFHQFPRDEELAKLWNRILKRGKPYTKYSKVCSLHFKPEDYTITSVGKNKGQWRTLRKDAIPSQNLPSESPAPYTRRSSGCWVPSQPSLTNPLVQQQMAQAIYMQTMLAMQAAGASDSLPSAEAPPAPESKPSPSSSSLSEIELLLRRDTDPKEVTFKCHECSKCFKDPDVFLLHKRTHKNDTALNIEKENYSANIQDREETLRANPILANLLKTSMRLEPESNMANILTVENQIMAALASNMEAYIRTLSSMLAGQSNAIETEDNRQDASDYEEETKDDGVERDAAKLKCEEDGSDYEDETKHEDDGVERDAKVKCEEDGSDYEDETKHEDDGVERGAKVKCEEDGSDYEDETKHEDDGVERDAELKCEDMEKDMCAEQDTPMDEDQEDVHSDRNEDDFQEEIPNNLSTLIASDENQMETLTNEHVYPNEIRSIDDNTTRGEAHNRQIDEQSNASDDSSINDNATEKIHEAFNVHNNHKSGSNETNTPMYEAPNDAMLHDNEFTSYKEIRNGGTENEDQENTPIDENHMCTEDETDDTTRNTYEVNDALVNTYASDAIDDNDTSKDEMSDDDGKLVAPACDSETVELTKIDVEYAT